MKKINIVCGVCQNACHIEVEYEGGEVWDVSGNGCMKGMIYAQGVVNDLEEE